MAFFSDIKVFQMRTPKNFGGWEAISFSHNFSKEKFERVVL